MQAAIDDKKKVITIFFDLQKAFDSVDRTTLLRILFECGIQGKEYKWFENYLSNRMQFTECEKLKSDIQNVLFGVIQGSSLGPTLFSCYISDLLNVNLKGKPFMYADDLAIVYSGTSYEYLEDVVNQDLSVISEWMNKHKLTVNTKKTKYVIFKNKRNVDVNIRFNKCKLERMNSYKYLGVTIDAELNWNLQINEQLKKGRRIAGIFKHISKRVPQNMKRALYYSMFHSTIMYAVHIWGNAYMKDLSLLQKIQNKAIKNLYGYHTRSSTKTIHKLNNILPVDLLIKYKLVIQIHLILTQNINTNTAPTYNREYHRYNTRSATDIRIVSSNVRFNGHDTVYNLGYKYYNELPIEIRKIDTLDSFKKKLNEFYLNQI